MKAELPGFKSEVRQNIALQVDQRLTLSFSMKVGEVSERLVVTESGAACRFGDIIDRQRD